MLWIQVNLLNYPDISFKTVKMIIDNFRFNLSEVEYERNRIQLQIISELTSKQISIDSFILNDKINNLENDLDNLKDSEV